MYWSSEAVMTWVEQYDNSYYPPHKRRRVDSGFGLDYEPQNSYDPEFASVVDDSMLVEVDHGAETISMEEKKTWYFRDTVCLGHHATFCFLNAQYPMYDRWIAL